MAELLTLRGRNALSPFRIAKLLSNLAGTHVTGISAEFWHFVRASRPLMPPERTTLERILTYGPRAEERPQKGELLLVAPRPGTVSPWSSKATDIAHNCGLGMIERIERGIAYRVATRFWARFGKKDRAAVLPLIHDRMTEAIFPALEDAAQLFAQIEPRPLATIDLSRGGRAAIEEADAALGLALSTDEIDYLIEQ